MFSVLGSTRVEARVRYRSRTANTTPGEAGGGVSADAPVIPDDDPADDPVIPDDVDPGIPDADAPIIPVDDAPMIPDIDGPIIADADAPMTPDVDDPMISGDAVPGSVWHLAVVFCWGF